MRDFFVPFLVMIGVHVVLIGMALQVYSVGQ